MLYISYGSSKRKLYINVKAIGKILLGLGMLAAYFYVSHQDYLTAIGKH